jgi:hypothetical protein
MSLDLQIKTLLAIEKILHVFLWKGHRGTHGAHYLVSWDWVCMHKELGGLVIINLRKINLALRVRWLWLSRVEASRLWKEFEIQVLPMVTKKFEVATSSVVGDNPQVQGITKHLSMWKYEYRSTGARRKIYYSLQLECHNSSCLCTKQFKVTMEVCLME